MGRSGQLAGRQMKCISGISLPIPARLLSIEESILLAPYYKRNLWNVATRCSVLTETCICDYMWYVDNYEENTFLFAWSKVFLHNFAWSFDFKTSGSWLRAIFQAQNCRFSFNFSFIFCTQSRFRAVLLIKKKKERSRDDLSILGDCQVWFNTPRPTAACEDLSELCVSQMTDGIALIHHYRWQWSARSWIHGSLYSHGLGIDAGAQCFSSNRMNHGVGSRWRDLTTRTKRKSVDTHKHTHTNSHRTNVSCFVNYLSFTLTHAYLHSSRFIFFYFNV